MFNYLSETDKEMYKKFTNFVQENVEEFANEWDMNQQMSRDVIKACGDAGFLGGIVSKKYGGQGWTHVTFGLLNECFGKASASLSSLFTVQTMVAMALEKWGTEKQKEKWLTKIAKGEIVAAFAITEPNAGSDIQAINCEFIRQNEKLYINGKKKWITFGEIADLLLVVGKMDGQPIAGVVEAKSSNIKITPIKNMLGLKASHTALIEFDMCEIKEEDIVGRQGFGLSCVATTALQYGRLSMAWASTGILDACLEKSIQYAECRKAFRVPIIEHQLIREIITNMGVNLEAARLMSLKASNEMDEGTAESINKVLMAKYYASRAAAKASSDAVQVLGAYGCNEEGKVARYYRDSKIIEIIEGSNQVLQNVLAKSFSKKEKFFKEV